MPIYEYKATNASGKDLKDVIEADSIKSARLKLKKSGIFLTDIQEQTAKAKSRGSLQSTRSVGGRVPLNELALMVRQLSSLLKANVPLVESLTALIDQVENDRLRVVLSDVRQKVNEGSTLAKALSEHPKVFSDIFVNMVESGEASGTLSLVLLRLADFTEAQVKLRSTITSAMMYPIIMVVVASLIMVIIFTFAMPKIVRIFEHQRRELPMLTKVLIGISNLVTHYWMLGIIAFVLGFWIFSKWKKTKVGKKKWDRFVLNAPLFGKIVRMINISRFASTLSTLISSGVPLLPALGIVKNIITNTVLKEALENARSNITEGQSIAGPLKESGEFPPVVTHMIAIGEKTGELEDMLETISNSYEEQVKTQVGRMTGLLEPIMMVGMGITVFFIVFAIVMPLMEMNRIR